MNMQMQTEAKKCSACNVNPVHGKKAKKCETCRIALQRVEGTLAVYRHRIRAASGRARHNTTYRGQPTKWVIDRAIEVLRTSGVIK